MKCVSLWQPWASLLFSPEPFRKEFETRPRAMGLKAGETIAIQAARTLDGFRALDAIPSRDRELIERSLMAQFPDVKPRTLWQNVVPFGAIIGTLRLGEVLQVYQIADVITDQERAFGDFREGRFAITTRDPLKFPTPIEYLGQQGVFFVPDHVIHESVTDADIYRKLRSQTA